MADPFTNFITRLVEFGFFKFLLPFILFIAIIYALLKKSKVFESDLVNATIAIITSFFILYFPVMSGLDIGPPLSRFFMQLGIFLLIFVLGLAGSSVLYPDLTGLLKEKMTSRSFIFVFIAIVFAVFVTSGLLDVYIKGAMGAVGGGQEKKDIYTFAGALIVMVVILIIASALAYRIKTGGGF